MKTRILLTTITIMSLTINASAIEDGGYSGKGYQYGNQGVVVNNYYLDNGYEYASRINRFHRTYVSFDFYSPLFTDIFWYNYSPYTWGVSIYDDWYYYGSGASRYTWRSGFGGSYWWGYDPWRDYNPWMGYGWSSWYNPGITYSVNFYLGRPHNHYPVTWNNWHHHHNDHNRPVYNVYNNNYYNYNTYNNYNYDRKKEYNPSHPYDVTRRAGGYTSTSGGRGSSSTYTRPSVNEERDRVTRPSDNQDTRTNTGNSDSRGNNAGQTNNDRDRTNNGLHMGQERRGVAEPTGTKPNTPERPHNPNVNDRTNPGREQNTGTVTDNVNRNRGNASEKNQSSINTDAPGPRIENQGNPGRRTVQRQSGEPKATIEAQPRQQTQTNVRTNTRGRETTMRQGTSGSSSQPGETSSRKSNKSNSGKSTQDKSSKDDSGVTGSSSRRR